MLENIKKTNLQQVHTRQTSNLLTVIKNYIVHRGTMSSGEKGIDDAEKTQNGWKPKNRGFYSKYQHPHMILAKT